jgi:hypothetical protein
MFLKLEGLSFSVLHNLMLYLVPICKKNFFKRLPGMGSEPGSSSYHLFSHFHHFTAKPQRLPDKNIFIFIKCIFIFGDVWSKWNKKICSKTFCAQISSAPAEAPRRQPLDGGRVVAVLLAADRRDDGRLVAQDLGPILWISFGRNYS